jgi:hypothetical protein
MRGRGEADAPPEVAAAQLLGALARRRAGRREALAELRGALTALGTAVERHALRVDALAREIAARAGGPGTGRGPAPS